MSTPPRLLLVVLTLLAATTAHAAQPLPQIEVTTCGQIVPPKTLGYLTADLDCADFTGGPTNVADYHRSAGVYLSKKSQLDLRGFTLTAGLNGVLCDALLCNGRKCPSGVCQVFNGTVSGVLRKGAGIYGERLIVHDVTVQHYEVGIAGGRKLLLSNAFIDDTEAFGVAGGALVISGTAITNSGQYGVQQGKYGTAPIRLSSSSVTGSGWADYCLTSSCGDVFGLKPPRIIDTVCETSVTPYPGKPNWGICFLD